jgi:hypothetical protein
MKTLVRTASLLVSLSLAACGGSSTPTPATPPPTTATATAAAPTGDVEAPRLVLGPATIMLGIDQKRVEILLAADGTVTASTSDGTDPKRQVHLNGYGDLEVDGTVRAKLGTDGAVTVLDEMIEERDGKVVKQESKWTAVGVLDADGAFTASKDNRRIAIDAAGKVTGFPGGLELSIQAEPAVRRAAMYLVIAMLSGSRVKSGTSGSSTNAVVAPQPIKP